jgi:hypothetical protein
MHRLKASVKNRVSMLAAPLDVKERLKKIIDDKIEQKLQEELEAAVDQVLQEKLDRIVEQKLEEKLRDTPGIKELFRGLPIHEWPNTNNFDRLYSRHGVLKSTANMSSEDKFDATLFFQYRDKAEVALCVASNYAGGDYMEFGSTDLNTFRNFLSAFDIFNLVERFPDTRFYGFDIFGNVTASDRVNEKIDSKANYREYINHFKTRGDLLEENIGIMKNHGLFVENCHLIQGFFEDTLSNEFKSDYLNQGRRVGFACFDCNMDQPYKLAFEFLIDIIHPRFAFIYMDEYYSRHVTEYFDQFVAELNRRYNLKAKLVRNAGAFGALFYFYRPYEGLLNFER